MELTGAYAVFGNGGEAVVPHEILEIRGKGGVVLYRRLPGGLGRVIDESVTADMIDLLSAVINEGTGRAARLDRPAAGKTGTSQDYRDAWFIGFTSDLTAGVWVGNDDNRPMKRVTGGGLPAEIWRDFMLEAHRGIAPEDLMMRREPPTAIEETVEDIWENLKRRFGLQ